MRRVSLTKLALQSICTRSILQTAIPTHIRPKIGKNNAFYGIVATRRYYASEAKKKGKEEKKDDSRYTGLKSATEEQKRKAQQTVKEFTPAGSRAEKLSLDIFSEAAQFEGAIDSVWADFERIDKLITQSSDVATIFKGELPFTIRKKGIDTLLQGNKFHPITVRALELLAEAKRVQLFPQIFLPFKRLVDTFFQRVTVTLLYAPSKDYTSDYLSSIISRIRSRFPEGTRPELAIKADPQLIRGYKVVIGNTVYLDTSLSAVFDRLAKNHLSKLSAQLSFFQRIRNERATTSLDPAALHKQTWDWILDSAAIGLPAGKVKTSSKGGVASGAQEDLESAKRLQHVYNYVLKS